ncbi:MAG TPA: hypothetical protein DCL21_07255 [Alphaproteobacteria bacterium]|nr:hypothetical protein [Alphaproteobacteria bacterium]
MTDINTLVNSLEKVKTIRSPYKRSIKWFGLSLALMLIITYAFKYFTQQNMFAYPLYFYIENAILTLVAYCAILSAFLYSSPDEQYQLKAKKLAVFCSVFWIGLFSYCLYHCYSMGHIIHQLKNAMIDYQNFIEILSIGAIPAIWLILMLRKAFPTHKRVIGVLTILGSLTLAMVFSRFLDIVYEPTHMIIWRYTPVLILAILSYWFSDRLLSR